MKQSAGLSVLRSMIEKHQHRLLPRGSRFNSQQPLVLSFLFFTIIYSVVGSSTLHAYVEPLPASLPILGVFASVLHLESKTFWSSLVSGGRQSLEFLWGHSLAPSFYPLPFADLPLPLLFRFFPCPFPLGLSHAG